MKDNRMTISELSKEKQISELEETFAFQCKAEGLPRFLRQIKPIEGRKFSFDFYWPKAGVLVEINGGTYSVGGHSTGKGIHRDYEKLNLAQKLGYRVFQFDCNDVKDGSAVKFLKEVLV